MRIALIGKPEHSKAAASRLRQEGHEVEVVETTRQVPPGVDLVVCRNASASHQSSWDAADLRGKHKVIFDSGVTKILSAVAELQKEKDMQQMTNQQKIELAVKELGIFHPLVEYTDDQINQLFDLDLVKSIRAARTARDIARTINVLSSARQLADIRSKRHTYTFWRMMPAGPGRTQRSQLGFIAENALHERTLRKVAQILNLELDRQTSIQPEIVINKEPEVIMPAVNITESAPEPVVEPVLTVVPTPLPMPTPPPVPVLPPRQKAKADIKELLELLNEALLTMDVRSLIVRPGADGPAVEFEQVVVRKVSSFADLEDK